jgi:hypothetical protein
VSQRSLAIRWGWCTRQSWQVSGVIRLVAVPPVLLGTAYGIWKQNQLDQEVWQVVDMRSPRVRLREHRAGNLNTAADT